MVSSAKFNNGSLFYPLDAVCGNKSFFWVGRGGFGVTHPGNENVRWIIASKIDEYQKLKRSQRGVVVRSLLDNELRHIKFVTPRQAVLKKLEADDNRRQNDSSTEDCCDENSDTNSKNRRVGGSRRKSLLDKHGSIDRILSYPKDVCVEVGYEWTVDIISHLLRDDGICKRNKQQNDAKSQQCGKKQKRQRATKTTKTAPIKRKRERQNTNSRVCDTTVRVSCDMNSEVQGDCELFEQIFPEESGADISKSTELTPKKVDNFVSHLLLQEEKENFDMIHQNDFIDCIERSSKRQRLCTPSCFHEEHSSEADVDDMLNFFNEVLDYSEAIPL